MLTFRGRRILFALISEYISTGEPVSSQTLTRGPGVDLSAASIRAVFGELEGQGYLHKPHASAGRVPTERGLRAFVDALLTSTELPGDVRDAIHHRYTNVAPGLDAALRHAGRMLADYTGAAAVVMAPPMQSWVLKDLRFISVRPDEVLAVIVSGDGAVQNRMLRLEQPLSPSDLERSNNIVQSLLEGRTLQQVRQIVVEQLQRERSGSDSTLRFALALSQRALSDADADVESAVLVEGHAQLIGRPEFADIDRARSALRTLEDKERLIGLLDRTLAAPGMHVRIGAEDEATEAGDLSVVAAPVGSGAIGVIGSTRMDYSSVLPAVRYTAALLQRRLDEPDDSES